MQCTSRRTLCKHVYIHMCTYMHETIWQNGFLRHVYVHIHSHFITYRCVYTYIYIYIYICTYHAHMFIHIFVCTCICICKAIHLYTYMHETIWHNRHVIVYAWGHIAYCSVLVGIHYVNIYTYIYIYMCIHICMRLFGNMDFAIIDFYMGCTYDSSICAKKPYTYIIRKSKWEIGGHVCI